VARWGGLLVLWSGGAVVLTEPCIRLLDLFPTAREAVARAASNPADPAEAQPSKTVLHPFRGWSTRGSWPTRPRFAEPRTFSRGERSEWYLANNRTNLFGFRSGIEDYRALADEDFVVGVFGGSVASFLSVLGGDAITRVLAERHPTLHGSIRVLNFGMGGYKQPQQLMVLAEMLVLGVPLDAVVNVDGFNEVAYGAGSARAGLHPVFPNRGPLLVAFGLATGAGSAEAHRLAAELLEHKREASRISEWIQGSPALLRLELARAVVGARLLAAEQRLARAEARLQDLAAAEQSANTAELPAPCLGDEAACRDLIADLWARSSIAMAALARDAGALYVHALQPNQYVPGTKTLNSEEREHAYEARREVVIALGYPHLQRRGALLAERGVAFHDLTPLFAESSETLYRDPCCHYNWRGNQLLGEAVGRLIADELDRAGPVGQDTGSRQP
jgi:hypothetical protein